MLVRNILNEFFFEYNFISILKDTTKSSVYLNRLFTYKATLSSDSGAFPAYFAIPSPERDFRKQCHVKFEQRDCHNLCHTYADKMETVPTPRCDIVAAEPTSNLKCMTTVVLVYTTDANFVKQPGQIVHNLLLRFPLKKLSPKSYNRTVCYKCYNRLNRFTFYFEILIISLLHP